MKILSHESMSRWYTLSFDEKRQGILISVDREFAKSVIVPVDSPIVYYNSKKLDADGLFDRFSPSMDEEFGWNGSLKKVAEFEETVDYLFAFPRYEITTHRPCMDCSGTGKNEFEESCHYCNGDKVEIVMDYRNVSISAISLALFFDRAHFYQGETLSKKPQLLLLNTIVQAGLHGGSLGGKFGPEMAEYLHLLTDGSFKKLTRAMMFAHSSMVKFRAHDEFCFRYGGDNGRIYLSCPGNACDILMEPYNFNTKSGGEISCHNVDSAFQQITLLVGLAKLCDLWEEQNSSK
jgi:hypothetical protein